MGWTKLNEFDGVARIAHLLVNDSRDAAEVIHETFRNVSRDIQEFHDESSLRIWIFRIAVSRIQKRLRWWKRGSTCSRRHTLNQKDDEAVIRHGLSRLPTKHRVILVLRDIEGLSYDDISKVLQLPPETVKTRLRRARSRMMTAVMQQKLPEQSHAESDYILVRNRDILGG